MSRALVLRLTLLSTSVTSAGASPLPEGYTPRLLVLSAFPAELDALLPSAQIERIEEAHGRAFYVGSLQGHDVVLALTGIGLVNAERTTTLAFEHFRWGDAPAISGVVFSGVSGGNTYIGDVTVPTRWTMDGGGTWVRTDPRMLAAARSVAKSIPLARTTPSGDPACAGTDRATVQTVSVEHQPRVILGGDGYSADPFGGRRLPCFPGGGDVFGCDPCLAPSRSAPDPAGTAEATAPSIDPTFFLDYFQDQGLPLDGWHAADDMETAAVAKVAAEHGVPFIGFRGLSDGKGDPLNLPGFPAQFFVYKDLAARNAGAMALAFLRAWKAE
jgi:nucleoside phosphorylase